MTSTQVKSDLTDELTRCLSGTQKARTGKPLVLEDWSAVAHVMEKNPFMTVVYLFQDWEEYPVHVTVPFTGSKVLNLFSDAATDAMGITDAIKEELTDFAYILVDRLEESDLLEKLIKASKADDDQKQEDKLFERFQES